MTNPSRQELIKFCLKNKRKAKTDEAEGVTSKQKALSIGLSSVLT
jgi:hypothetical protein